MHKQYYNKNRKHFGTKGKKFLLRHFVCNLGPVSIAHFVPVDAFEIKEAVIFVDSRPKCVEIAYRIIVEFFLAVT